MTLRGHRAVVTGASRGIGQTIAEALAAAGANVASLYLDDCGGAERTADRLRANGREAIFVHGTTTDEATVDSFARTVDQTWGGVDIWVNNAAVMPAAPFLDTRSEDWRAAIDTNVTGYYHGCRAAARIMARLGRGSIINVASVAASRPVAGMAAYATSKAAIVGLTRAIAVELAPLGITVNAISPGPVLTPTTAEAHAGPIGAVYRAVIPLGRPADPADVAGAAVYLASEGAQYVTGVDLRVDGGLSHNGSAGFFPVQLTAAAEPDGASRGDESFII